MRQMFEGRGASRWGIFLGIGIAELVLSPGAHGLWRYTLWALAALLFIAAALVARRDHPH